MSERSADAKSKSNVAVERVPDANLNIEERMATAFAARDEVLKCVDDWRRSHAEVSMSGLKAAEDLAKACTTVAGGRAVPAAFSACAQSMVAQAAERQRLNVQVCFDLARIMFGAAATPSKTDN